MVCSFLYCQISTCFIRQFQLEQCYRYENGWVCTWCKIIFKGARIGFGFGNGALTLSLLLKLSLKIGALIRSMKRFLKNELARCLYKFATQLWMLYCCHVLVGTPNCYLDMLEKLKKQLQLLFNNWLIVKM